MGHDDGLDTTGVQTYRRTTTDSFNHPYINFETLKSEQARLNTFHNPDSPWPVTFISPSACAKAGFFFLKDGDKVQCAFCRGVAGEWEEGDIPLIEHKKHFPRCPFICPDGNIPIGQYDAPVASYNEVASEGYDVCGRFECFVPSEFTNTDQVHVRGSLPLTGDSDNAVTSLAIRTGSGPARKHFVTVESRLKTFVDWPESTGQRPETMAEAGFFYIGTRDYVKCFYCDGGLRNWEECDNPWFEHARWFAKCPYVLLNKGSDYISEENSKPQTSSNTEPKSSTSSESDTESLETPSNSSVIKDTVNSQSPSPTASQSPIPSTSSQSEIQTPSTSDSENSESSDEDEDVVIVSHSKAEKDSMKIAERTLPPPSSCSEPFNSLGSDGNLEEELRKLKEARRCKICMDNEVNVVFLPCGHLVSCVRCATALSNCALCRQPIKAAVRTYLS